MKTYIITEINSKRYVDSYLTKFEAEKKWSNLYSWMVETNIGLHQNIFSDDVKNKAAKLINQEFKIIEENRCDCGYVTTGENINYCCKCGKHVKSEIKNTITCILYDLKLHNDILTIKNYTDWLDICKFYYLDIYNKINKDISQMEFNEFISYLEEIEKESWINNNNT